MARNRYDIDEKLETPFDMRHFKRSFVYVGKYKMRMIASLTMSAIGVLISLFTPVLTQYAIDHSIPDKNVSQLMLICAAVVVCIFCSVMLERKRAYIMAEVAQNIIYDIRMDLYRHLQKLPFTYYDDRPHGKILVRVVQYVNNVSNMLSNGIINFIIDLFNIVFITIFMLFTDLRLGLLIVSGMPILIAVFFTLKPLQRKAWQSVSNKGSNLNAYLQENINGMRVTQIFTREKKNQEIFLNLSLRCRKAWMFAIYVNNLMNFAVINIQQIVSSLLYVAGVIWFKPMASLGTLYAMSNYSSRFWQPIANLAAIYNDFMNTIAYLERIFETMDQPVDIDDAPDACELPDIKGAVEFKNVTFAYEADKIILKNLSFKIEPGQSVALVGPTGAGKSTIVNLISRFYDVQEGQVLIDGYDVSKVTLHSLRSQMGIMLQDSFIFSGTIADNIRYGRLDATLDQLREASRVVHVDEFIESMKDGYDTEVQERGGRLSQGQKQLISFARTIISDPRILILDEATSAIDTKTEQYVQEGIAHLLKNRTSFIIAHRLSTIKNCDKIMYVSNQTITEYGTHDELMAKKGDYYHLYTAQLSHED